MNYAALIARDVTPLGWVSNVVGPALQADTEDVHGFSLYIIQVLEETDGVSQTHNFTLKIKDYEGAGEEAVWKGAKPGPSARLSTFRQWIEDAYTNSLSSFKGLVLHHIDEVGLSCYFSRLEDVTPATDPVTYEQKFYWVKMGSTPVEVPTLDVSVFAYTKSIDGRNQRD